MRAFVVVVVGVALVAACARQAEPDSNSTSPSSTTTSTSNPGEGRGLPSPSTPTSTSSASASTPPTDPSASPAITALCTDSYSADLDALRKKCSPEELSAPEGMARTAAKLCARDLAMLASRGLSTFDEAVAKQCIATLKTPSEKKPMEGETFFARPPCDRIVLGKQGDGEACRFPPECKDGLACDGYKVGVDGVCKKLAPIGGKCAVQAYGAVFNELALAAHHGPCVKGAYCSAGTCVARGAVGAPCARSSTCTDGLVCTMSKCAKSLAASGGVCSRTADCGADLYCDVAASKCAPKKSAGSDCTNDECKGWCDVPKKATAGKCASSCGSG